MAGDTNSNIFINIDTSQAMAQLRALEKELTALNRALIVGTKAASQAQSKFAQSLLHNVNATGQWSASMVRMSTATDQFANRLEKSKLSLKEYYRYGMASTRSFGRFFRNEYDTLGKLAEKRVKVLQQQYVQLGRDASGAMQAMRFTPKTLNYNDVTTRMMLAIQRQQMFNRLLDDGSTKLLNFGKNTQWAGRQLMVGFTIPLLLFGSQAIRTFKEIETQTIRFKKVYGDLFTNEEATDEALKNINKLANEYTKYGLKVADTIKTAADAAAAGFEGDRLQRLIEQTNKLAILGGVTQEKSLETTIALQNAFKVSTDQLASSINYLNAVENQTVLSLEDITEAIPRVGPIITELGGDIKDLSFFLTAMKEGGVNAAQGANALKSGLGRLINPTKAATKYLADFGINLTAIVEQNAGNLRATVMDFATSIQSLDDLSKARAVEKVFGKFQFARILALLNNITREGTQASRVLDLANRSAEELALLSQRELKVQADSPMNQLAASIEKLKVSIAPIGKIFAETLKPAIDFLTRLAEKFNNMPEGFKKAFAIILGIVGGIGPIFLMTFGLVANAMANSLKGVNLLRKGYQQLAYGSSDAALKTQFLTNEELENISITNSLYAKHQQLSAAYKLEQAALASLRAEYRAATTAMSSFAAANPGLFLSPAARGRFGAVPPIRRAGGGTVKGPGTSTSDSIPAYLSDGEYVINAKAVDTYGVETFDAINARKFSKGGPVIGKDGIPRLSLGGWMTRIMQLMLPRTNRGILQTNIGRVDDSALRNMTGIDIGGGRKTFSVVSSSSTYERDFVSNNALKKWKKIKWKKDNNGDGFTITDPVTKEKFRIASKNKKSFDEAFDEIVQQNGVQRKNGPKQSPGEFLITELKYRKKQGKNLTVSEIFKHVGLRGANKNKNAPSSVKTALEQTAKSDPSSAAAKTLRALNEDIQFLKNSPDLSAEEKNTLKGLLNVAASHIDPKDRFLWTPKTVGRDVGVINNIIKDVRNDPTFPLRGSHVFDKESAQNLLNFLKVRNAPEGRTATEKAAMLLLERRLKNSFYNRVKLKDTDIGLKYQGYRTDPETRKSYKIDEYAMGGLVKPKKYALGTVFVGMPKTFAAVQKNRMLAQSIDARVRSSRFREMPPTDFGVKTKNLEGHSFPIPGVGGIYRRPNGSLVVVKPVIDEKAALAEQRATIIARKSHGLKTPKQQIKTMIDPTDPARKRRFLVLESPYDPSIAKGGSEFTKKEYFKQLVASTLRGDKDLSPSNVFGGVLADAGTAGVFGRASGKRDFAFNMPSMAEQALVNLLGIKGGAKRAFAENTLDMIKKMNAADYQKAMIKEINSVLPKLKQTISTFELTKIERVVYDRMIKRLEAGRKVNWQEYHAIHSNVKPKKYANGVFSVPGPKGAGDVVPAMLSPGEAVVPARQSEKYRPLIRSIIADNVPGYKNSNIPKPPFGSDPWGDETTNRRNQLRSESMRFVGDTNSRADRVINRVVDKFARTKIGTAINEANIERRLREEQAAKAAKVRGVPGNVAKPFASLNDTVDKNTSAIKGNTVVTEDGNKVTQNQTKAEQKVAQQARKMQYTQRAMIPSMGLAMAGPMLAMSQQQKNPEGFIARNAEAVMMGSILASVLLPLINTPLRALSAGLLLLIGAVAMHRKSIQNAIIESVKFGESLHNNIQTLESFGAVTGKMSATQVQAEKRANRVSGLSPYDLSFGVDFIKGEAGQNFRKEFLKTTEGLTAKSSSDILASRLSQAVTQNVLTYDQAESFGIAIARSLNDTNMELDIVAKLRSVMGPDGQDLTTKPLDVQLRLIANNNTLNQQLFKELNSTIEKKLSKGWLEKYLIPDNLFTMKVGGPLAGGALAGAALGAYGGVKLQDRKLAKKQAAGNLTGARNASTIATTKSAYQSSLAARGANSVGRASKAILALRAASVGATATGGGALVGIPALIASIAAEQMVRYFQRGEERKQVGKVSGALVGSGIGSARDITMGIDAIREASELKVTQLENELLMTKEANKRLSIEKQINEIKTQTEKDVESLIGQRKTQFDTMLSYRDQIQDKDAKKIFDDTIDLATKQRTKSLEGFQKTEADQLKLFLQTDAFTGGRAKASEAQIIAAEQAFKAAAAADPTGRGTAVRDAANELQKLKKGVDFDPGRLKTQINMMINAGVATDAQVLTLLQFAERTDQNPQYYIDIVAGVEDPSGILDTVRGFMDNDQSIQVYLDFISEKQKEKGGAQQIKELTEGINEFKKAKAGLEQEFGANAIDIDNLFKGTGNKQDILFGENGIINQQNLQSSKDEAVRVGKEIGKINAKLNKSQWAKATTDQRRQMLLDIKESYKDEKGNVVPNKTIDDAIANWNKISTLDKDVQLQAVFTTQVITSAEMQDEIRKSLFMEFEKGNQGRTALRNTDFNLYYKSFENWAKENPKRVNEIADKIKNQSYDVLFGPDGVLNPNTYKPTKTGDGPKLDVGWIEDLAQRLKLFKESSLDATGSYQQLMSTFDKWLNKDSINKSLDNQKGALLEIKNKAKEAGISLSKDFISVLEQLSPEQFELISAKIFEIDKQTKRIKGFKSAFGLINEAFNTATIGEYIDKQRDSIFSTEQQIIAFNKLQKQGINVSTSLKLISDSAMVSAIASSKLAKSELDLLQKTSEAAEKIADKFKTVANFKEKMEQISQQTAAYNKLRMAGIQAAQAAELSNSPETARAIVYLAAEGGKAWEEATKQIRNYAKEQKDLQKLLLAGADAGDYELYRLESAQKYINLQGKLLEMQQRKEINAIKEKVLIQEEASDQLEERINFINKMQIDPKQGVLDQNQYKLQEIAYVEDQINQSYDEQIKNIDKIYEINSRLVNLEKSRLTIADALTRGDISAAAAAVQDARSQESKDYQESAKIRLEEEKDLLINSLGRKKIEEQNKTLQLEIMRIQRDQLNVLEKSKQIVDDEIEANNKKLAQIDLLLQKQKQSITFFGLTGEEIEDAVSILQSARDALIDINDPKILEAFVGAFKEGTTDAENLNKLLSTIIPSSALQSFEELQALRNNMNLSSLLTIDNKGGIPAPFDQIISAWDKIKEIANSYAISIMEMTQKTIDASQIGNYASNWSTQATQKMQDYLNEIKNKIKNGTIRPFDIESYAQAWIDGKLPGGKAGALQYLNEYLASVSEKTGDPVYMENGKILIEELAEKWNLTKDQAGSYYLFTEEQELSLKNLFENIILPGDIEAAAWKNALKFAKEYYEYINNPNKKDDVFDNEEDDEKTTDIPYAELIKDIVAKGGTVESNITEPIQEEIKEIASFTQEYLNKITDDWLVALGNKQAEPIVVKLISGANLEYLNNLQDIGFNLAATNPTTPAPTSIYGGGGMYDNLFMSSGGMVKPKYFANGAIARGTDKIPAMLTPGEFVMRKYAVQDFGLDNLNKINDGSYDGGAVYNYNLSVNVKSDANPNDIARTVISQIKQIDSQRIRNQR